MPSSLVDGKHTLEKSTVPIFSAEVYTSIYIYIYICVSDILLQILQILQRRFPKFIFLQVSDSTIFQIK